MTGAEKRYENDPFARIMFTAGRLARRMQNSGERPLEVGDAVSVSIEDGIYDLQEIKDKTAIIGLVDDNDRIIVKEVAMRDIFDANLAIIIAGNLTTGSSFRTGVNSLLPERKSLNKKTPKS